MLFYASGYGAKSSFLQIRSFFNGPIKANLSSQQNQLPFSEIRTHGREMISTSIMSGHYTGQPSTYIWLMSWVWVQAKNQLRSYSIKKTSHNIFKNGISSGSGSNDFWRNSKKTHLFWILCDENLPQTRVSSFSAFIVLNKKELNYLGDVTPNCNLSRYHFWILRMCVCVCACVRVRVQVSMLCACGCG